MKKIQTEKLKDGMRFTKAVYIDEENVFVQPHLPLKQKEIDRLMRWQVQEVFTDGEVIPSTTGSEGDVTSKKSETGRVRLARF